MKPYWSSPDGIAVLYHGNCESILPLLDTTGCSVLTDPPYGVNACNRKDGGLGSQGSSGKFKFYGQETWDSEPAHEAVAMIVSLGRPTIIWGGSYYDLPPTSCLLIWDKIQRGFSFADAEVAWTNLDTATRVFSYWRTQLTAEGKVHPTQKPLPLMEWCLTFLPAGDTVIDPFAGSATTGVACIHAGRKFIGIERELKYVKLAVRRLEAACGIGTLFEQDDVGNSLFAEMTDA